MKTAYLLQAREKRTRLLLEREPDETSDFVDTEFDDDMPELAGFSWPEPDASRTFPGYPTTTTKDRS
jgi:hypothetical protein